MSYYRKKVYDSHNGDSKLNARTGQVVEVLRELTDREADIADVGRMFHVRFADVRLMPSRTSWRFMTG